MFVRLLACINEEFICDRVEICYCDNVTDQKSFEKFIRLLLVSD